MNCPHCHRMGEEEIPVSEKFLEKLKKNPPELIKFIGGEPTLYMDKIEKFVNTVPNTRFSVSTNAKDLDKYNEYFKKHNFLVVTSYDGLDSARPEDPLNHDFGIHLRFSTTVYKQNINLSNIYKGAAQKEEIINSNVYLYPHIANCLSKLDNSVHFNMEDADSYMKINK